MRNHNIFFLNFVALIRSTYIHKRIQLLLHDTIFTLKNTSIYEPQLKTQVQRLKLDNIFAK